MTVVEQLGRDLLVAERALERQVGEARHIAQQGKRTQQEIAELTSMSEAVEEAIGVLNQYADSRQGELQSRIETLLTHGLRTIFGDSMSFHIAQTQKGKLAAADFVVRSQVGGQVLDTPVMESRGGGVAAVVGFLLRLIILLLKPGAMPLLVLDESFAQLSEEYEPSLSEFIRELVDKTPVQIVLVTHSTAYNDAADVVYRFEQEDGRTRVTRI